MMLELYLVVTVKLLLCALQPTAAMTQQSFNDTLKVCVECGVSLRVRHNKSFNCRLTFASRHSVRRSRRQISFSHQIRTSNRPGSYYFG